jgi:putative transposase
LRTKVTKGPGSRAAGLAMAYKLIDAAQTRWRAVNAPPLVALVRAGAVVHKGKLLERSADITPTETGPGSTETEVALKALAQVGHYPVLVLLVRCGAVCGVP